MRAGILIGRPVVASVKRAKIRHIAENATFMRKVVAFRQIATIVGYQRYRFLASSREGMALGGRRRESGELEDGRRAGHQRELPSARRCHQHRFTPEMTETPHARNRAGRRWCASCTRLTGIYFHPSPLLKICRLF